MDIPVHIDVELVLAIGGKEIGDSYIGFISESVDISVEGLDTKVDRCGIVSHAVGGAGDAVAREGKNGMERAVGKAIVAGEVVLIAHVSTQLQMVAGDVFAKGGDVGIGERSLAVMVGGVDGVDMMAYGAP